MASLRRGHRLPCAALSVLLGREPGQRDGPAAEAEQAAVAAIVRMMVMAAAALVLTRPHKPNLLKSTSPNVAWAWERWHCAVVLLYCRTRPHGGPHGRSACTSGRTSSFTLYFILYTPGRTSSFTRPTCTGLPCARLKGRRVSLYLWTQRRKQQRGIA